MAEHMNEKVSDEGLRSLLAEIEDGTSMEDRMGSLLFHEDESRRVVGRLVATGADTTIMRWIVAELERGTSIGYVFGALLEFTSVLIATQAAARVDEKSFKNIAALWESVSPDLLHMMQNIRRMHQLRDERTK